MNCFMNVSWIGEVFCKVIFLGGVCIGVGFEIENDWLNLLKCSFGVCVVVYGSFVCVVGFDFCLGVVIIVEL